MRMRITDTKSRMMLLLILKQCHSIIKIIHSDDVTRDKWCKECNKFWLCNNIITIIEMSITLSSHKRERERERERD